MRAILAGLSYNCCFRDHVTQFSNHTTTHVRYAICTNFERDRGRPFPSSPFSFRSLAMNLSNLQQMISEKESELARFRQAANDAAQQKEEEVRRHTLGELLKMIIVAAIIKLVDLIN